MKYVQINRDTTGWAKSIVLGKHNDLLKAGHESYVFWGRGIGEENEHCRRFSTDIEIYTDALLTRLDGKPCFHSKHATKKLLKWLDEINPDVVHIHNLLGYYVNIEMLFSWLASSNCKVLWTLHDCWAFTGHCMHFSYVNCTQWKTHCGLREQCPQLDTYPETLRRGMEDWNYEKKKRLFTLVSASRMSLISPSKWLAGLVGESFLSKYEVEVIPNTIDSSVFKPTDSSFRKNHGLNEEHIILGVAAKWTNRKGIKDFIKLSRDLDSSFAIVLVGIDDKRTFKLPDNIVCIGRTNSPKELAAIYTAADVLFNPTQEDNYPTVNLEAEACGTPVITYDTGGCRETIFNERSCVVRDYSAALEKIKSMHLGIGWNHD